MGKDNCCNGKHEGHNCQCDNHDHNHDHDHEEMQVLQLTLDDDTVLNCQVLGLFEVEDKEYIALLPEDDERVLLYEYIEEDEEIDLKIIEDDKEFDIVSEAYYELFNDEEE